MNIIFLLVIFLFSYASKAVDQEESCKKYDDYIEKAKEQWPYSQHITLSSSERESFVISYNSQVKDDEKLIADEMMLFPLHDSTYWYVLAGNKGCFVFWTNIEGDKFIELLDGSILSKGKGIWREGLN